MTSCDPTSKATICCILVSHRGFSLKFVRAGGHYDYTIIRQPQKSSALVLYSEATFPVKDVMSGDKHSNILGRETSFSCFAVH